MTNFTSIAVTLTNPVAAFVSTVKIHITYISYLG